jgi:hypothetical protein
MILKKVALPLAVDGKSYWEDMILAILNDKFCSLRANFMQELYRPMRGKRSTQPDLFRHHPVKDTASHGTTLLPIG